MNFLRCWSIGIVIVPCDPPLQDEFVKEVTLEKASEQVNELNTRGGFYTEQEMKDELKYSAYLWLLSKSCFAFKGVFPQSKNITNEMSKRCGVTASHFPPPYPRSRVKATIERGEKDPTYMMFSGVGQVKFFLKVFFVKQVQTRKGLKILLVRKIPSGPRIDDVDDSIVFYWCNVRTEGSLKNRQSQMLKEKVSAKGTTDSFKMELLPKKLDLPSLGHQGPSAVEKNSTQATLLLKPCCNIISKSNLNFFEFLDV